MKGTWFGPFHHPLSGNVIPDEFAAPPITEFPSLFHFPEFVPITLGRHLQQLVDKSWLVFYFLHIFCKSLAKKTLYVSLKLLPTLIRFLLIHVITFPF
jgi:hypothetical protein